jgi:hypothetical protein
MRLFDRPPRGMRVQCTQGSAHGYKQNGILYLGMDPNIYSDVKFLLLFLRLRTNNI